MSKKPRENRVPIMMSEAELTAVDDWRFANRVATRSEAIRRLCKIGLSFDREAHNIFRAFTRSSRVQIDMLDEINPRTSAAAKALIDLGLPVMTVWMESRALGGEISFEEASQFADDLARNFSDKSKDPVERMKNLGAVMSALLKGDDEEKEPE